MTLSGSLTTVDGRPALSFLRHLPHDVERVWRAVTDPAELAQWFVAPAPWTPVAGETFSAYGQDGRITELDQPRRIAWTFGEEAFSFDLERHGDGCRLVFVHVFAGDEAVQHAAGWEVYLHRLDAALDGVPLDEEAAHGWIGELHERYAAWLGQDPEPGRAMIAGMAFRGLTLDAGPQLRLERRYRHGVNRLWRALTDPDELAHWFPGIEAFEVTASDPPRRLAGRWHGEDLAFELRPDAEGCVLTFVHAFADRDTAARTAAGWDRCFARVDALLAGVPLGERESLALWPAVHERYAATFGVDPEVGRQAFAEHPAT